MKKLKLICLALVTVCLMASCHKPAGNANVYSSTVSVNATDWYWDNTSWRVDIDYDAIDFNVTNYGAVLVYMNYQNTWRQIPLTLYYSVIENQQTIYCSYTFEVSYYNGGLTIFQTDNDFYNQHEPGDQIFKIVALSSVEYNSRPDVDYSNYEAVKTAFQLND